MLNNQNFQFLSGYSDLIQYIGVCNTGSSENEISSKFVEFLLTEKVQNSLNKISLFSVKENLILYTNGVLSEMENILKNNLKTINVFTSQEKIKEINKLSINALEGDKNALKSVMNNLI